MLGKTIEREKRQKAKTRSNNDRAFFEKLFTTLYSHFFFCFPPFCNVVGAALLCFLLII